jgi:hypothetical protein
MSNRNRIRNRNNKGETRDQRPDAAATEARSASEQTPESEEERLGKQSPFGLMAWLWGVPIVLIIAAVLVKAL